VKVQQDRIAEDEIAAHLKGTRMADSPEQEPEKEEAGAPHESL